MVFQLTSKEQNDGSDLECEEDEDMGESPKNKKPEFFEGDLPSYVLTNISQNNLDVEKGVREFFCLYRLAHQKPGA